MTSMILRALAIAFLGALMAACTHTEPTPAYGELFETKHGIILTTQPGEQAVYRNGSAQTIIVTEFLIREDGTGDLITVVEAGSTDLEEGDEVVIVYGPETRVVADE